MRGFVESHSTHVIGHVHAGMEVLLGVAAWARLRIEDHLTSGRVVRVHWVHVVGSVHRLDALESRKG